MSAWETLASKVEVVPIKLLLSSPRIGWWLRNIHILNDNGSFSFDVDFVYRRLDFYWTFCLNIWVTRIFCCEKGTVYCLPFASTLVQSRLLSGFLLFICFGGGLCCGFFSLSLFCILCLMLRLSVDCSFLIASYVCF